jgi:hypothetical protein
MKKLEELKSEPFFEESEEPAEEAKKTKKK